MLPKQNPFSIYDFLGYFVPGALGIYLLAILHGVAEYGPGHRSIVMKCIDFPSGSAYVPFILAAYTFGHLLSYLSSVLVESYSVGAYGYPSRYMMTAEVVVRWRARGRGFRPWPLVRWISLLPISFLDAFVGDRLGLNRVYIKNLDPLLREIITGKISRLLSQRAPSGDANAVAEKVARGDYFRFVYHYALENAPNHVPKMQNYVALYGFLRTLTLLCVGAFWVTLLLPLFLPVPYCLVVPGLLAFPVAGFVAFMAFNKFYRRFTLEAFMAVAVTYPAGSDASGSRA